MTPADVRQTALGVAIMTLGLATLVFGLTRCAQGNPLTPADDTSIMIESTEDTACVTDNVHDAGAIDPCRAAVKARWDAFYAAKFADGGGK